MAVNTNDPQAELARADSNIMDMIGNAEGDQIFEAIAQWNRNNDLQSNARAAAVAEGVRDRNDAGGRPANLPSWHRVNPTEEEIQQELSRIRDEL